MAVVDRTRCKKRIDELLLAIGQGAARFSGSTGGNSRYPDDNEIYYGISEADAMVVMDEIETIGHPDRTRFLVASSNLASGDLIPAHIGALDKVEIDDGTGFKGGTLASSRAEVLEVVSNPTLYPTAKRWYWIEGSEIVHTGTNARVYYPSFTINLSACQAHEVYESAVIAGAMSILAKDGALDPGLYNYWANLFAQYRSLIRSGKMVLPEISQAEKAA